MIMTTAQEEKLLRVGTVAERLSCSARQVYKLIEEGKLECVKIGSLRGYRVTLSSLERFIASHRFA